MYVCTTPCATDKDVPRLKGATSYGKKKTISSGTLKLKGLNSNGNIGSYVVIDLFLSAAFSKFSSD